MEAILTLRGHRAQNFIDSADRVSGLDSLIAAILIPSSQYLLAWKSDDQSEASNSLRQTLHHVLVSLMQNTGKLPTASKINLEDISLDMGRDGTTIVFWPGACADTYLARLNRNGNADLIVVKAIWFADLEPYSSQCSSEREDIKVCFQNDHVHSSHTSTATQAQCSHTSISKASKYLYPFGSCGTNMSRIFLERHPTKSGSWEHYSLLESQHAEA